MDWIVRLCEVSAPPEPFDLSKADLIAQQQMACWAGYSVLCTLLGVILSALALLGLLASLRQTSKSLRYTQDLGQAQTRAYVHAAAAEHLWTNNDGPYTALIYVENVGETPAKVFEVGGELKKVRQGEVTASISQKSYPMKPWSALGPKLKPTSVRLDLQTYAELAREFLNPVEGYVVLLTGTIRYLDVYGAWFETDFAFFSYATAPNGPEATVKLRRPTARVRAYEAIKSPKAS